MKYGKAFLLSSGFGIFVKGGNVFKMGEATLTQDIFSDVLTDGEYTPLFFGGRNYTPVVNATLEDISVTHQANTKRMFVKH